mmetsp:Transcript_1800/g.6443  ORF Transcript_1800/g.6443 Transcript_1800/m.6443 type:complete len:164 (+) Transcript_1800:1017-1508(+)
MFRPEPEAVLEGCLQRRCPILDMHIRVSREHVLGCRDIAQAELSTRQYLRRLPATALPHLGHARELARTVFFGTSSHEKNPAGRQQHDAEREKIASIWDGCFSWHPTLWGITILCVARCRMSVGNPDLKFGGGSSVEGPSGSPQGLRRRGSGLDERSAEVDHM